MIDPRETGTPLSGPCSHGGFFMNIVAGQRGKGTGGCGSPPD